jgi:hypothetical protein
MITIEFLKDGKHAASYTALGGQNLYQAEQDAKLCQQYSLANVCKVSVTQVRVIPGGSETSGDFGAVGLYAHMFFLGADEKEYAFKVHAPKDSIFEDDNTVKQSVGEAFAVKLSAVAGQTLTFQEGALCGES